MSWWTRIVNGMRARRVDRDLDEELQFHVDQIVRELMASGLSREEARARAARRFGDATRWREQSRDVKLLPWLDSILRDTRIGLRTLRKNAAVTAAAVCSLALALGACAAAFSLVDALILRPLPVRNPEQLVYLAFPTYSAERPESDTFNDPIFVHMRAAARDHADLFAMSTQVIRRVMFAPEGQEQERLRTQYVSGDAFTRLAVAAAAGRLIDVPDDTLSAAPVAILSHAFWMRRFAGDPAIVGRSLTVEDKTFHIAGVAEPRFTGIEPGRPTDVWLPYSTYNSRAFGNVDFNWFRIIGRVHGNVSVEQAHSVVQAAFMTFRREHAGRFGANGSPERTARFIATPLLLRSAATGPSPLRRQYERPLWMLIAIAALVLLIAAANIANLFLARSAAREREMALRISIGAGRGRLIQQMLVESGLVAIAASALGVLFAAAVAPAVVAMLAPFDDPVHLDVGVHWRLVAFTGLLTLLSTSLFGVIPALRASDVSPLAAITGGGGRTSARARTMRPFVAVQFAFGLAVLFVGSLLVLSFSKLSAIDPGFAKDDVLLLSVETARGTTPAEQRTALMLALETLRRNPALAAVSAAEFNVLGRAWTHHVRIPGTTHDSIEVTMSPVTPGYFATLGIPLRAGRDFTNADLDKATPNTIVVNEAFATRYFGNGSAIGRLVSARFGENASSDAHEVIGVIGDVRYDVREPPAPSIYIPLTRRNRGTIHVRTAADRHAIEPQLREEIRAASPLLRVTTIRTQAEIVDQTLLRERVLALLSAFFAALGLTLAAVGVYAVLSYSVAQRTREIGIRVALGARPSSVMRMTLAELGIPVLVGVACGLGAGLYLARFVESLLFEVTPRDMGSVALPLATLLAAAGLAAVLPARRAARVDPIVSLRCE
ncbi:MAG TPA: ADOP family duplicated permease [Vicinamibacterales bacterium]|nr:ADOP family duplicated permease [Vicinamibacterales bacterium]